MNLRASHPTALAPAPDLTPLVGRVEGLEEWEVRAMLAMYPSFVPELRAALDHARACFGDEARVALETLIEYSGDRTLFAVIVAPGPVEELMARLERFDELRWNDEAHRSAGPLSFTVASP